MIHHSRTTNSTVSVGGRTYTVPEVSTVAEAVEPCPWCLRMPVGGDDVVRCDNPHCRRLGHRRCFDENGGCGGVCGVL